MNEAPVTIRDERADDSAAIRRVIERAFGQPLEVELVDALRRGDALTVSLVPSPGALAGCSGIMSYRPEFEAVST